MASPLAQARNFMGEHIWDARPQEMPRHRALGYRFLRVCYLVGKGFSGNRCRLHASALTYTTLVSLVPFLAFAFAVAKGLRVQDNMGGLLGKVFLRADIAQKIIDYVDKTDVRTLGALGLIILIWTVIQMLSTIEGTFNEIWGVRQQRSLFRKFSDYLSVVVVTPLLLAAAVMMTAALHSSWAVAWLREHAPQAADLLLLSFKLLPYAAMWVVFTCFYMFMPNTKVPLKAALGGAVAAGTLWQVGQWLYLHGNVRLARYNAIYASFASFPVFLVWLYLSWLITLFGAEVAFALEHERTYQRETRSSAASHEERERLALQIAGAVTARFRTGQEPLNVNALAEALDLPVRLIQELGAQLEAGGILKGIPGPVLSYHPGRAPDTVSLKQVLDAVRRYSPAPSPVRPDGMGGSQAAAAMASADEALSSRLSSITLDAFARGEAGGIPPRG